MIKSDFSSRLREIIEEQGAEWTPASISSLTGFAWTTAKQWVEGSQPRTSTLEKLARELNVNPSWLIGENVPRNALHEDQTIYEKRRTLQNAEDFLTKSTVEDDCSADFVLRGLSSRALDLIIQEHSDLSAHSPDARLHISVARMALAYLAIKNKCNLSNQEK